MSLEEMIKTVEEKEMLLEGLARIIYADGILTDTEKDFFKRISLGLGVENVDFEKIRENKKIIAFPDKRTCMYFLTQAVQLCYVDGSYDENEREELLKICDEMGISEKALEKVEQWVEDGIEWNNKGVELLDLE